MLFRSPFGLFGLEGFFLSGNAYDTGVYTLFLFQMVFMDTTVTIPTGAMAERWKWSAFCVFGLFMSMRNIGGATEDQKTYGPHTPLYARFRQRDDYGGSLWTAGIKGTF